MHWQMAWIDLLWSAPSECPTHDRIVTEVGDLIGGRAPTQKWRAEAVVERRAADSWSLRLTTEIDGSDNPHVREMTASSCTELAHAAAVVLAVDVDPHSAPSQETPIFKADPKPQEIAPQPASRPIQIPFPTQTTSTADAPATAIDRHGPRALPKTFAASAIGVGSIGVVKNPAFGVGLALAWVSSRFRVELGGQWFPSAHVDGSLQNGGGDFNLLRADLTGCYALVPSRLANLSACTGMQVGRLQASGSGSGLDQSTTVNSLWLAPKAGGLFTFDASDTFALRLNADLVVPLERQSFLVSGEGSIQTTSPIAFETSAGVELRFP